MSLARHVDPEDIVQRVHPTRKPAASQPSPRKQTTDSHLGPFSTPYASQRDIPKYRIPQDGAPADTVYQMLKDELDLDGRTNLNLASFVNTWMESNATQLMVDNLAKNLADSDEYPALMQIHERCISILAHLWGVRPGERAVGSATTGSSEAIHLGGLAMKRRWQERCRAAGRDAARPNVVMGANAQVALEKFARYFDVEARILPVSAASQYRLDPALVGDSIDENTIGVFVILGSTYTGHYEPVEEVSRVLDDFEARTGVDIPIHVDAASGGFVAPFADAGTGSAKWNFELPRVKSINASGHKYGLTYPGVGWIIWRDESFLPEHLIFELHYLGGTEKSFTLNFSRPGAQVIAQYYNLVHLGFAGFREVMENCLANARTLARSLEATGWYTVLSEIHRPAAAQATRGAVEAVKEAVGKQEEQGGEEETSAAYVAGLPVVSFRFSDDFKAQFPHLQQETVSLLLRARQWIVPNYALPPNEDKTEILRVVVRDSMTFDLLDRLISDIVGVTQTMMDNDQIDLAILQKPRRKLELKSEQAQKAIGDVGRALEKEGGRMAEGIHRSVC